MLSSVVQSNAYANTVLAKKDFMTVDIRLILLTVISLTTSERSCKLDTRGILILIHPIIYYALLFQGQHCWFILFYFYFYLWPCGKYTVLHSNLFISGFICSLLQLLRFPGGHGLHAACSIYFQLEICICILKVEHAKSCDLTTGNTWHYCIMAVA